MTQEKTILAVDIGTSSARAAVFRTDGTFEGLSQIRYGVLRPAPFMEEQNPDAIRQEVYTVIDVCLNQSGVCRENIEGIVFSSQMYSVFPIDSEGKPLCNSILWSDGRAEAEANALQESGRHRELYRETGCPVSSIYPLSKILWLKKHRTDLCAKVHRFVSIKEYVIAPLIADWVVDYSMASGMGMFDGARDAWSPLALETTGVNADQLPRLIAGDAALAFRNDVLRKRWGLSGRVCVFAGGGDGPLANLGSGAFAPGDVNIDLGTSGAARIVTDRPVLDTEGRLWRFSIVPGRWAFGGIVSNVGNAWQWLASTVATGKGTEHPEEAVEQLGAMAAGVPAGAEGVFFLPYLRKVRAPWWDDRLRGSVFGLTVAHDGRHLARAMLEAIAFDLADILAIGGEHVTVSPTLILTGGLSKSGIVPQILADVTGRTVVTPENSEGSLAGAAIVGLHGAGLIKDFAFDRKDDRPLRHCIPQPATHALYEKQREAYNRLVDVFRSIPL